VNDASIDDASLIDDATMTMTMNDANTVADVVTSGVDSSTSEMKDGAVVLASDGGSFTLPVGDYIVATNGSDSNDGLSLAKPFKTITQCANIVTAGKTCFVRAGTYRESVKPLHSGSSGLPVVIQSVPGDVVIVSGADVVSGTWTESGSIYATTITLAAGLFANQVFVDGVMVPEAQWPNASADILDGSGQATAQSGTNGTTIVDSNLNATDGYWAGASIHVRGGYNWTSESGKVTAQTGHTLTLGSIWNDANLNANPGSRYYLFGKLAALDTAGEWFYDGTSTLSLWPPDSKSPTTHVIEVKARTNAFDLSNLAYVNIEGINVFAATILTSYGSNHIDLGSIGAQYVSHFTTFTDNPYATHQGDTGIILAGTSIVLHDSEIQFSAGNGVSVQQSGNTVTNTLIHDTDYGAVYVAPILVSGNGHTITRNTIYRTGRDGIFFGNDGSGGAKNDAISLNDVFCVGALNQDEGAMYGATLNFQGTVIDHNWTHDLIPKDNRGFNGPSYPAYTGVGIYLDNGSTNGTVHHNVSWNNAGAGIQFNGSNDTGHVCVNNTVGNGQLASETGILTGSANVEMINNIFLGSFLADSAQPGAQSNNLAPSVSSASSYFTNLTSNDYRLSASSPAIGAGTSVSGITTGVTGNPDVGAYQSGEPWTPGCSMAACTYAKPVVCMP
jgi:hypothetical protein